MLEYKQRNVNRSKVTEPLDFLEPHIQPTWLVPQYPDASMGAATASMIERVNNRYSACLLTRPRIG